MRSPEPTTALLLERAANCARLRHHAYLSPAHLLCAMCEDQALWSTARLGLTSAQCEMVMWELNAEELEPADHATAMPEVLPLTSGMKALLQRAERRASQRGEPAASLRDIGESLRDRTGGIAGEAIALAVAGEAHPPPALTDE